MPSQGNPVLCKKKEAVSAFHYVKTNVDVDSRDAVIGTEFPHVRVSKFRRTRGLKFWGIGLFYYYYY